VSELDHRTIASAYARWAPVYDLVFDKVMAPCRRALAKAANWPNGTLIVGVGKGLKLPYLSPTRQIVGVDLSQAMLQLARNRIRKTTHPRVRIDLRIGRTHELAAAYDHGDIDIVLVMRFGTQQMK
jgi:ubiquinone/menaquinone biosynthesis C-methylase UbiE